MNVKLLHCICIGALVADLNIQGFVSFQRNGADYAVYVNTAQEFDGSDSGGSPDEAMSWGKIKVDAKPVKVFDIKYYKLMSKLCSNY